MKTATKKDFKAGTELYDESGFVGTLVNKNKRGDWSCKRVLRDNCTIPVRMAKFYKVSK